MSLFFGIINSCLFLLDTASVAFVYDFAVSDDPVNEDVSSLQISPPSFFVSILDFRSVTFFAVSPSFEFGT